ADVTLNKRPLWTSRSWKRGVNTGGFGELVVTLVKLQEKVEMFGEAAGFASAGRRGQNTTSF
ncbi:hypothetical protein GN956_G26294, partial [Arapaima gigas]